MYKLKNTYSSLVDNISIRKSTLFCDMRLQPSQYSSVYEVHIEYKISGIPRVWLISPKVEKFNGAYPVHNYGVNA